MKASQSRPSTSGSKNLVQAPLFSKKTKQIGLSKSPEEDSDHNLEVPTTATTESGNRTKSIVVNPLFKVPIDLIPYYEYIGHRGGNNIVANCKLCQAKSKDDVSNSSCEKSGLSWSNFRRHLKRLHPADYSQTVNTQKAVVTSVGKVDTSSPVLQLYNKWKKPTNAYSYPKTHVKQLNFNQDLLDLIAIDLCPLNICERPGFIKLITNLDKSIKIPCPRTVGTRFKKKYKQFLVQCKRRLANLLDGSLHIIIDIWTSNQQYSVIGFKAQYISEDWKLHNITLGFKHFGDNHTAQNIRAVFDEFLARDVGLSPNKIGLCSGDNASNMMGAFCIETEGISIHDIDSENEEDESNDNWLDTHEISPDEEVSDADLSLDIDNSFENFAQQLDSWTNKKIRKMHCMAHLLQLAIKDCFDRNKTIKLVITRVNSVVSFFKRTNHWYTKLREITPKGLSLIKPGTTRWSSTYHALNRIGKEGFVQALNKILQEIRSSNSRLKRSVPKCFDEDEVETIAKLCELLKPLAELTNELQADGVTSSLVILGVTNAYKRLAAIKTIDGSEILEFQEALCKSLYTRFGCTRSNEKTGDRRIVQLNMLEDEPLILATMLDPRLKYKPFQVPFTEDYGFDRSVCTPKTAENVLRKYYEKNIATVMNKEVEFLASEPKRKKQSLFDCLESVPKEDREKMLKCNEVDDYLKMPIAAEDSDPLEFWKNQEHVFPTLAKLARIYLAFPASSGSVERLFSISGAIARARRAKIKIEKIEQILCYRDYRLLELFS